MNIQSRRQPQRWLTFHGVGAALAVVTTLFLVTAKPATSQAPRPEAVGPPRAEDRPQTLAEPRRLTLDTVASPIDSQCSPLQDDATLHDVAWVGASDWWAVGDRGAVWRSNDGGRTWTFHPLPGAGQNVHWRSIQFLTDRVGWIAGMMTPLQGGPVIGVLWTTADGGANWQPCDSTTFPPLRLVRFFDLEHGVVIGARSLNSPTGVMFTDDGGGAWTPANDTVSASWNAGAFFSFREGVVVGERGAAAVIAQQAVMPRNVALKGLEGFHDVCTTGSRRCWLAGDGAQLLLSDDRGAAWRPPATPPPRELSGHLDFLTAAAHGDRVWATGRPGSRIWHSPDCGTTWTPQPTLTPTPLHRLRFKDEQHGVAVGALGRICLTVNGGAAWTDVRGAERRLAVLAVHPRSDQTPAPFLVRWAGEEGYRSGVWIGTRLDLGPDASQTERGALQLEEAVLLAGGNAAQQAWRWPLSRPLLDRRRDQLINEWNKLSDDRLGEALLNELVAQLRMWRPSAVVLSEAEPGDAATELFEHALRFAVEQAGDPQKFADQLTLSGLEPWDVQKIIQQRAAGQLGGFALSPQELLPRMGNVLDLASRGAVQRLKPHSVAPLAEQQFQVIYRRPQSELSDRIALADMQLPAGGPARRALPSMQPEVVERLVKEGQHRRNLNAISRRLITGTEGGGQLLGQLDQMLAPLSPPNAAEQLSDLALAFRREGDWGQAEAIYAELVTRYPQEPQSLDALRWLLVFWSSGEVHWQRLRTVSITQTSTRRDLAQQPEQTWRRMQTALENLDEAPLLKVGGVRGPRIGVPVIQDEIAHPATSGDLSSVLTGQGQAGGQQQMLLTRWLEMAAAVQKSLQESAPLVLEDPQLQFVSAALARRRQQPRQADAIYDRYLQTLSDDPWNVAARGEAYLLRPGALSPKPVIAIKKTALPPVLDGKLTDPCWSEAVEIRLGQSAAGETFIGPQAPKSNRLTIGRARPIVFVAYDKEYLYLAASVPIETDSPVDPPQLAGRTPDGDFGASDRVCFQFDVDRDYATYYAFDIAQTGQTRDACWENQRFNPTWHCAVARGDRSWELECAIPLQELTPAENVPGAAWAMGIVRILPGVTADSWSESGGETPLPPRFGLLRFE